METPPEDEPDGTGDPGGPRRIEFPMEWKPGHVAAYLVERDEPVLVDAGMPGPDARETLEAGLAAHGYAPGDVAHVVLTHPHTDHVGQVPALVEAGDPTVYAPSGVRRSLRSGPAERAPAIRRNATRAGLVGEDLEAVVEYELERVAEIRDAIPLDGIDVWFDDGDAFPVGDLRFDAIHTPGHQVDHYCLAATIDGERTLLSGDMAIPSFRPILINDRFEEAVERGVADFERSLDRLDRLSVDRVCPAHGAVHADLPAAVERSRGSLDRLLDAAVAFVADGGETAVDFARERFGEHYSHRLPEAMSALAHLDREGRVASRVDADGVRRYRGTAGPDGVAEDEGSGAAADDD